MLWRIKPERLRGLYRHHFLDRRRERLFLSSFGFFLTFAGVRGITHAIRAGIGPFHNLGVGHLHVHHLVPGIVLLHLVGYIWLNQLATGADETTRRGSAVTAALYGTASALTLDEFALWLDLEDVYWAPQGRASIDAIILFGALLSISFWGRPFLHALAREARHATHH